MIDPAEFIVNAKLNKILVFDVEYENKDIPKKHMTELWGCSVGTIKNGEELVEYYEDPNDYVPILTECFPDPAIENVAYNLKHDIQVVRGVHKLAYPVNGIDPMVGVNLLDDNRRPNQLGLKPVVLDWFNYEMMNFEDAILLGHKHRRFHDYSKDDSRWELRLWLSKVKPGLVAEKLDNVFYKIVMKAIKVFADMEFHGALWDVEEAKKQIQEFARIKSNVENEIRKELGYDLNLNSGDQLADKLFNQLGFSSVGIKPTKSGGRLSVDADAMDTLAVKYPICAKIREYRLVTKMIGTYLEPTTLTALDDPDNRIHPQFWLVSSTGRTRCENPNLQNIPKSLEKKYPGLNIRKCFKARPGFVVLKGDLSQIELRIMAHITKDSSLLKAYLEYECTSCGVKGSNKVIQHKCPNCGCAENEDILKNKSVKGFWHGLDLHQMTYDALNDVIDNRDDGKTCNFAIIYYATEWRMHYEHPKYSTDRWREIIEKWMDTYPGVRKYHAWVETSIEANNVFKNIFGRKRRIPKHEIRNIKTRKHAVNQAINAPAQSGAGDFIEIGNAKNREELQANGMWEDVVFPMNFVHDECVYEVREDVVETVAKITRKNLEEPVQLAVPVRVDIKVGINWGACKPYAFS